MARITSNKLKISRAKFDQDAEEYGLSKNFLFLSTLKRLDVQLDILTKLEDNIEADGPTVTKEYVKGRANIYTNPAIDSYNKTAQQANNTTQVLVKIIKELGTKAEEDVEL